MEPYLCSLFENGNINVFCPTEKGEHPFSRLYYYNQFFSAGSTGQSEPPTDDSEDVEDDDDNFADKLPPEVYCDLIETLSDKCGEYSLLEIWKYDEGRIRSLSIQARLQTEGLHCLRAPSSY